MGFKKLSVAVSVLFLLFSLFPAAACTKDGAREEPPQYYALTVERPSDFQLLDATAAEYAAGERVALHTQLPPDFQEARAFLDGDQLVLEEKSDEAGTEFLEVVFVMPASDATLLFQLVPLSGEDDPEEPPKIEELPVTVAYSDFNFRNRGLYTFSVISDKAAWDGVRGQFPEFEREYGEEFFADESVYNRGNALIVIVASRANTGGGMNRVRLLRYGYDDIVIDIEITDGNMTAASDWALVLEVKKEDILNGRLRLQTNFSYNFNTYL